MGLTPGDTLAENDLVIILMSGLPEEYGVLLTVLENIAEDMLTWDYAYTRFIHEKLETLEKNLQHVSSLVARIAPKIKSLTALKARKFSATEMQQN